MPHPFNALSLGGQEPRGSSIPESIDTLNRAVRGIGCAMRKARVGDALTHGVPKMARSLILDGRHGDGWTPVADDRWREWFGGVSRMHAYRLRRQLLESGILARQEGGAHRTRVHRYRFDMLALIRWLAEISGVHRLSKMLLTRLHALADWSKGTAWTQLHAIEDADDPLIENTQPVDNPEGEEAARMGNIKRNMRKLAPYILRARARARTFFQVERGAPEAPLRTGAPSAASPPPDDWWDWAETRAGAPS